ncbi:MAG TPA: epoxide hydrolase [Pseudomonadales bacterium]|nr:epoxide hydrolase [Pseudomonadales bacterium]
MVTPFKIAIPDSEIAALHARIDATRWPDQIGDPWVYGTDITYLRKLVRYWRDEFDWRTQEAKLNRFDQFKTTLGEHEVHFIHQRSTNPHAPALLITHGWPGSVSEFVKIIAPLTQPEQFGGDWHDAFHVICPSIPGYGFSKAPSRPGFQPRACAELFMQLMEKLGYTRYFAQGGDVGSAVTTWLGALAADRLKGIHLNLVFARPPKENPMAGVTDAEAKTLEDRRAYMANEVGYQHIQGSKPQTLGYALNDSPVGLAAWITEKFHKWTQHRGNHEDAVTKDEILTDVSIYWFTQTITSSVRMYYESRRYTGSPFPERVDAPTAVANFPGELFLAPRAWVEKQFNLVHWSHPARGGHFAALEAPDLLVDDIRAAFRPLR